MTTDLVLKAAVIGGGNIGALQDLDVQSALPLILVESIIPAQAGCSEWVRPLSVREGRCSDELNILPEIGERRICSMAILPASGLRTTRTGSSWWLFYHKF